MANKRQRDVDSKQNNAAEDTLDAPTKTDATKLTPKHKLLQKKETKKQAKKEKAQIAKEELVDEKPSEFMMGSDSETEEIEEKLLKRARLLKSTIPADESKHKGWINIQRTLVFCSRGVAPSHRHLMSDLRTLLPHSKKEVKMDNKKKLQEINIMAAMKNCNNCIFFEARRQQDLYMWAAKTPTGPSVKFHVHNIHTMDEIKLTGNCLKGSRPILHFDANFDKEPHFKLIKELFTQMWGTPKGYPKSKPFIDHLFAFYLVDNHIWFRNYQVVERFQGRKASDKSLVEIGPRFILNPIKIFEGSFEGKVIYENPHYVPPTVLRSTKLKKTLRYAMRLQDKEVKQIYTPLVQKERDVVGEVFSEAAAAEAAERKKNKQNHNDNDESNNEASGDDNDGEDQDEDEGSDEDDDYSDYE
eukprot:GEZU01007760.1.p1 GENE.GEZU01007760.1~~GEZU01007760.1.p1  ORF type:complete len:425 (-),score=149.82 GEZU01007760.1:146-1387(-)